MTKESDEMHSRFGRHSKSILGIFLFTIFTIVVLAAEAFLARIDEGHPNPPKRYIALREYPPECMFREYASVPGPNGPVQKSVVIRADENGFLEPNYTSEKPDLRIFFLGGSTTECIALEGEERFPYLVGQLMERATGRRVASYNSGKSGNNSLHSINILLNKLIPLKPDIVVLLHNVNDLSMLLYNGNYWNAESTRSPLVTISHGRDLLGLLRNLKSLLIPHLYQRIKALLDIRKMLKVDEHAALRGKRLTLRTRAFVEMFRVNLKIFINVCRENGITPVLMTQANRLKEKPEEDIFDYVDEKLSGFGIEYSDYVSAYHAFNLTVRQVGLAKNVPVIDLAAKIPRERKYMPDPIHFTVAGSRLASEIIAEELKNVAVGLGRNAPREASKRF